MNIEFATYETQQEMIKKALPKRILYLLFVSFFYFSISAITVVNNQLPKKILLHWSIGIFAVFVCSAFIFYYLYIKHAFLFLHKYYAIPNIIFGCNYLSCLLLLILYIIYTTATEGLYYIIFALLTFLILLALYSIYYFKKMLKKHFSKCYFLINERLFFDQNTFKKDVMQHPKPLLALLCSLLVFIGVQALALRSIHHSSGYAISIGWCAIIFFTIAFHFLICALNHYFFIQPKIEKHFNQPMLSDYWGFFKANKGLAEEFLGPEPRTKRPIQYEEIFPES